MGALALMATSFLVRRIVRNRSRRLKMPTVLGMIMLWVASAGLGLTFLFFHAMCGEYTFPPVVSPDHATVAQVTEFDCGATTPFTSHVRVRSTASLLGRFGLSRWSTVFVIVHDPRLIQITWANPNELVIRHPAPYRDPDELKCDPTWKVIRIDCETYAPDEGAQPLPCLNPAVGCGR
jgi:hypothetical protein